MLLLPWHLSDFLADGIGVTVPEDTIEIEASLSPHASPWRELVGVYSGLVDAVARHDDVTVLAGDCLSAVAVLAGMPPCPVHSACHPSPRTERCWSMPAISIHQR